MDPNECLRRFREAQDSDDVEAGISAARELADWISRGGFEPKWDGWAERACLMVAARG